MPVSLGSDVLELILDELGKDKNPFSRNLSKDARATLKACALASSVLRARAQYHIFTSMYVDERKQATLMHDIISSNPAIARNMKKFSCHPGPPRPKVEWMYNPSSFSLISLLSLLPELEQLALADVDFPKLFETESPDAFFTSIPAGVTRLSLFNCIFADSAQLVLLLHSLRAPLRHLKINTSEYKSADTDETRKATIPLEIALETLSVNALWGSSEVSQQWFSAISPSNLTKLEITLHIVEDVARWQACIDGAPHLQSLSINRLVEHNVSLNLSNCAEFRTLSATHGQMWNYQNPNSNPDPTRAFIQILGSATGSKLESAKLCFDYPMEELFALISWPEVQKVVNRVNWFNEQESFVIVLEHLSRGGDQEPYEEVRAQLEQALAEYNVRNVKIELDIHRWDIQ